MGSVFYLDGRLRRRARTGPVKPEREAERASLRSPPRSLFRQIAGRLGKKIIYLPLGTLSPVMLKKLRVFHVLFGRGKRETAKDYIW